jgi:hypothetical protein
VRSSFAFVDLKTNPLVLNWKVCVHIRSHFSSESGENRDSDSFADQTWILTRRGTRSTFGRWQNRPCVCEVFFSSQMKTETKRGRCGFKLFGLVFSFVSFGARASFLGGYVKGEPLCDFFFQCSCMMRF